MEVMRVVRNSVPAWTRLDKIIPHIAGVQLLREQLRRVLGKLPKVLNNVKSHVTRLSVGTQIAADSLYFFPAIGVHFCSYIKLIK